MCRFDTANQVKVITTVRQERENQNKKWGEQNHDDFRWLAILSEEVGEVAQAMLHRDPIAVHDELVQVAAVAVQWLECMERRRHGKA